jgi:hypothetical protein
MMRSKIFVLPVILLLIFTGACSSDNAQALFESAQLEERQNNPAHAKELYQEIKISPERICVKGRGTTTGIAEEMKRVRASVARAVAS